MIPFVDLRLQSSLLKDELQEAISSCIGRADFVLGEEVGLFEEEFGAYCGGGYAVGVGSGTDALYLALLGFGIGRGDEVITAANTFVATVSAISATGARPVLVDVSEGTLTIDPDAIEEAVTPRTRAVIPVHLYGRPAPMDEVMRVAERHGLYCIEDACQAHGALYRGRRAGSIGDAGAFSFYPGKNLGAFGDAGAVVTGRREVAEKIRLLRNHGQPRKYEHVLKGFNSRLDTIQAAVLRVKLKRLDEWNSRRARLAGLYDGLLKGAGVETLPGSDPGCTHSYHLYVIGAPERDSLQRRLSSMGISTGIHYPVPVHLQKAYEDLGYGEGAFPVTERYAKRVLSLPMYPELTEKQAAAVAEGIRNFAGGEAGRPLPLYPII